MTTECVAVTQLEILDGKFVALESQLATVVRMLSESKAAREQMLSDVKQMRADLSDHMQEEMQRFDLQHENYMSIITAQDGRCDSRHAGESPWQRRGWKAAVITQGVAILLVGTWAAVSAVAQSRASAGITTISNDVSHLKAFWGISK